MAKGISGTGQGFDAPGQRLGGYFHNPPNSNMRQAALAAAEKRARTGTLMPSGPRRLGGDSEIMQALSPIQAAAMAAERRLRDDLWCAAPDTLGVDGTRKAQEREDASGPALSVENRNMPALPMDTISRTNSGPSTSVTNHESKALERLFQVQNLTESSVSMWECNVCTLLNPVSIILRIM